MTAQRPARCRSGAALCVGLLLIGAAALAQEYDAESGGGVVLREGLGLGKGRFSDPFLSRADGPYLNYGWIDYRQYRAGIPIYKSYDAFGNYLTEGFEVFRMEERRAASQGQAGSVLLKDRFYQNWMRHLVIADDAYGGWASRAMVGDAIRTPLTPLTLDLARFNGIRWDETSANNRFTVLLSRFSDPLKLELKNQLGPGGQRTELNDGLYLIGGHWESRVGDFLVLGATYVNMHRFDATRGFGTNTRKGLAPPFTYPRSVLVRFQDDSPEDGTGGALVYDVHATMRLRENGQEREVEVLPASTVGTEGMRETARFREASGAYLDGSGLRRPVSVDYVFTVPDSTVGVTVAAVVANDYRILIRQDHTYANPQTNRQESRSTPYTVIRRASGNVRDQSNKQRVVFECGMDTGMEIVGMNTDIRAAGFRVRGEVARSSGYRQFAAAAGSRGEDEDYAGYVTVSRRLGPASLTFEGFSIGPHYTSWSVKSAARENAEAVVDPDPEGVAVPLGDSRTVGSTYYFNDARQDPVSTDAQEGGNKTYTPVYSIVDDNDDMDQWPDDWVQDWDVANREIKYLESDAGIYPFFDFDADGFPDNNRNRNQFADYDEPFLMYFTDPREFYFGADLNNNGLIDAWEDDDQPNYPYNKDERGYHAVAQAGLLPGLEAGVGRCDLRQLAGGGRTEVTYARLQYRRATRGGAASVRGEHETKWVIDDIADPYFTFRVEASSDGRLVPTQVFVADQLTARDSFVNRGLLHASWRPRSRCNLDAKLRYELNRQHRLPDGGQAGQPADRLGYVGLLAKGDYTRILGRLVVMPRAKVQYRRQTRGSLAAPLVEDVMLVPILRVDYRLTARSQLRLGVQGLPLLCDRRLDYRDRDNDSWRQDYVFTWFNQTRYEGFNIGTEAGVEYQRIDYDAPGRTDPGFVRYFFRMVAGIGASGD